MKKQPILYFIIISFHLEKDKSAISSGLFFFVSGDTSPCPNFFDRKGDSPLGSKFFSIPRELEGRGGALVYCLQLNNIT